MPSAWAALFLATCASVTFVVSIESVLVSGGLVLSSGSVPCQWRVMASMLFWGSDPCQASTSCIWDGCSELGTLIIFFGVVLVDRMLVFFRHSLVWLSLPAGGWVFEGYRD